MHEAGIAFSVLMLLCGASDILRYRIPNAAIVALAAVFVVASLLHWREVDWVSQIGAAGVCLVGGYILFRLGHMGAGDAKLLAVAALWAGLAALPRLLFCVSLAGLAVMLVLVGLRRASHRWERWFGPSVPHVLLPGAGIPFGAGIAAGAIIAMPAFPNWLGAV